MVRQANAVAGITGMALTKLDVLDGVKYIRRVEELTRTPVTLLSTSPERDDTILVTDPFGG